MARRERRIVLAAAVPPDTQEAPVDAEAAHYVTHVLRLADGATVQALERGGHLLRGVLRWREGVPWLTEIAIAAVDAPRRDVVVLAGLIKPARWEWMIEKAVELGATRLVPWEASRSVVRVPSAKVEGRVNRWQRIADSAARQCGRPDTVVVEAPLTLDAALGRWEQHAWWRADEAHEQAAWPEAGDESLVLVFGPEGGFTEAERAQLQGAGVAAFGLGTSLLRAETAVVCALSGLRLRDDGLL